MLLLINQKYYLPELLQYNKALSFTNRLANSSKESSAYTSGGVDEDYAEDEDWLEPSRAFSSSRKKRDKNSPRRNRGKQAQAKWKMAEEETHVDIDRYAKLAAQV